MSSATVELAAEAVGTAPERIEVSTLIGHEVGGVCPFGIKDGVNVYLDESLKRFDIVYPACGSDNSAVELSIEELEKTSGFLQ